MRRFLIVVAGAAVAWGLAGCGENTPVIYKQGQYQGKPDTQPWDSQYFKGDKLAWEAAIKKRNEGQNEYSRATPTAQ
jgi:hypothetical protein